MVLAELGRQAGPQETQNLSGRVFERMRLDILRCRLVPNARLRMDELREAYQVGLSPLREALMRLEAEGLVDLEQNKGFRVARMSREHLLDLGRNRAELECLALRWSIERGDVGWEANILSAFHLLSHQSKFDDDMPSQINEIWSMHHRSFHASLVAACGSPILLSMLDNLFDQAERYVAMSVRDQGTPRDDVQEHEGLMKAALARDVEKACRRCRRHIDLTTSKVAKSINLDVGE